MRLILSIFLFLSISCTTINNKADELIEKEEKYLNKFINKKYLYVIKEFGEPDIFHQAEPDSGGGQMIYNSKKIGIKCQRIFQVDEGDFVRGFSSRGCF